MNTMSFCESSQWTIFSKTHLTCEDTDGKGYVGPATLIPEMWPYGPKLQGHLWSLFPGQLDKEARWWGTMSKQARSCPTWESRKKVEFLVGKSDFQTRSPFWVQLLEALSLQRRQDLFHGAKLDQQQRGRLWPKKKTSHREDTRRNVNAKEAPQSGWINQFTAAKNKRCLDLPIYGWNGFSF